MKIFKKNIVLSLALSIFCLLFFLAPVKAEEDFVLPFSEDVLKSFVWMDFLEADNEYRVFIPNEDGLSSAIGVIASEDGLLLARGTNNTKVLLENNEKNGIFQVCLYLDSADDCYYYAAPIGYNDHLNLSLFQLYRLDGSLPKKLNPVSLNTFFNTNKGESLHSLHKEPYQFNVFNIYPDLKVEDIFFEDNLRKIKISDRSGSFFFDSAGNLVGLWDFQSGDIIHADSFDKWIDYYKKNKPQLNPYVPQLKKQWDYRASDALMDSKVFRLHNSNIIAPYPENDYLEDNDPESEHLVLEDYIKYGKDLSILVESRGLYSFFSDVFNPDDDNLALSDKKIGNYSGEIWETEGLYYSRRYILEHGDNLVIINSMDTERANKILQSLIFEKPEPVSDFLFPDTYQNKYPKYSLKGNSEWTIRDSNLGQTDFELINKNFSDIDIGFGDGRWLYYLPSDLRSNPHGRFQEILSNIKFNFNNSFDVPSELSAEENYLVGGGLGSVYKFVVRNNFGTEVRWRVVYIKIIGDEPLVIEFNNSFTENSNDFDLDNYILDFEEYLKNNFSYEVIDKPAEGAYSLAEVDNEFSSDWPNILSTELDAKIESDDSDLLNVNKAKELINREKSLFTRTNQSLINKVQGRILLQVEANGEAWYLDPVSRQKFYLENGNMAYQALRKFGLGITNQDLRKIPIGFDERLYSGLLDSDGDGLPDKLEEAIGTDPFKADTDGDGYDDKTEVINGYNPLGQGRWEVDTRMVNSLKGRIVLQVESRGEAWYINPTDGKRYFLGDGDMAYQIMRFLSLGITNDNLRKIPVGDL